MPNGFHGSQESWDRIEGLLRPLDPVLEAFAGQHGMSLGRNYRSWPERSLRWGEAVSRLIQIYLEDEDPPTWKVWVCASEDRDSRRYWKREDLREKVRIEEISNDLATLLEEARRVVEQWSSQDLEFAGRLAKPRWLPK
jgi:hypothetical protein